MITTPVLLYGNVWSGRSAPPTARRGVMQHPPHPITVARKRRKLKKVALAGMISVNPTTIYRWERGLARPQPLQLQALAAALQVDATELRTAIGAWSAAPPPDAENQSADSVN